MYRPHTRASAILVLAAFCTLAALSPAAEVRVSGAASLTEALKQIAALYEKESGDRVVLNLGASSILARQIEEGAPAGVFFSADEAQMDRLDRKGLLVPGSRKSLISNSLVIVVAGNTEVRAPQDLVKLRRIALADPKAVPIGVYARAYLEQERLWSLLEPKLVLTDDVRASLAAVESGNADASIVYKTDALISRQARVVFEVPREQGPRISYPAALVKDAKNLEAARRFLKFLSSARAMEIFSRQGFVAPAPH